MNNIVTAESFKFENKPENITVSSEGGEGMVSNPSTLGETFVEKCKRTGYISFENYSKFGTFKPGVSVGWKQGVFYQALINLGILCKKNRRYLPCEVIDDTSNYKENDTNPGTKNQDGTIDTPWFVKGDSGYWGFRFETLSEFLFKYHENIQQYADKIAAEEREAAELKSRIRAVRQREGITEKEVLDFFLTKYEEENRDVEEISS